MNISGAHHNKVGHFFTRPTLKITLLCVKAKEPFLKVDDIIFKREEVIFVFQQKETQARGCLWFNCRPCLFNRFLGKRWNCFGKLACYLRLD